MASFGENLRQARQARNITLRDISAATKISTRALQALEDERFDLLPGGIFNKGFVRSYARYVGLDEEKTIAEYLAAVKVPIPETDMETLSSQVEAARKVPQKSQFALNAGAFLGVLAVIVALVLGGLWLREHRKEAREQVAAQPPVEKQNANPAPAASAPALPTTSGQTSATAGAVPTPAPTFAPAPVPTPAPVPARTPTQTEAVNPLAAATPAQGTGTAQVASEESTAPVQISVTAKARAWVSVRADGKFVETLTLDPKKPELRTRSFTANEKIMLIVGNPAGISVTYNGNPTGDLGPEGQRTTFIFTPEGMEKQ
ncbi:MAG: hypothetical protein CXZ00_14740 [Acidobacteria bacterium]|nr:MAG: hypothetical protein CXZ00_14740 [Acidobacteriota bacterium]